MLSPMRTMRSAGRPIVVVPDVVGLVVLGVDRGPELVRRQLVDLGQQLPGVLQRVALEVVAEAEVAQHLEEGVVARRVADVLQVVVLAAGADALLRRGRARVGPLVEAEEHVLELVHPGVGEQQRRVVAGHHRARRRRRCGPSTRRTSGTWSGSRRLSSGVAAGSRRRGRRGGAGESAMVGGWPASRRRRSDVPPPGARAPRLGLVVGGDAQLAGRVLRSPPGRRGRAPAPPRPAPGRGAAAARPGCRPADSGRCRRRPRTERSLPPT